jgi:hypothetical protein
LHGAAAKRDAVPDWTMPGLGICGEHSSDQTAREVFAQSGRTPAIECKFSGDYVEQWKRASEKTFGGRYPYENLETSLPLLYHQISVVKL